MTIPSESSDHRRDRAASQRRARLSTNRDCSQQRGHSAPSSPTRPTGDVTAFQLDATSDDDAPIGRNAEIDRNAASDDGTGRVSSGSARLRMFDSQRHSAQWSLAVEQQRSGKLVAAAETLAGMLRDGTGNERPEGDRTLPLSLRARRIVQRAIAAVLREQGNTTQAAVFQQAAGINGDASSARNDVLNSDEITGEASGCDQAATLIGFAADRWFAGESTAAIELARSACAASETDGDADDRAISYGHLGAMLAGVGEFGAAIPPLLRAWRYHSRCENSEPGDPARHDGAVVASASTDEIQTYSSSHVAATVLRGDCVGRGWATFHLAEIAVAVGRYRAAQRLSTRSLREFLQGDCAAGVQAASDVEATARRCLGVLCFDATRN